MRMLKSCLGALLIIVFIFISACEKEVSIWQLSLGIKNSDPVFVNSVVRLYVEEYARSNDRRIYPDKFQWSIRDSAGNIIQDIFENESEVEWIPEKAGQYEAHLIIKYDKRNYREDSIIVNVVFDKRDFYTGNYKFIRYGISNYEGHATRYDTSMTEGLVWKDSFHKYKIHVKCGTGSLPFSLFPWTEGFSFDYNLYLGDYDPFYSEGDDSHYFFRCKFIGKDSLYIRHESGGLAASTTYKYYGSKIE